MTEDKESGKPKDPLGELLWTIEDRTSCGPDAATLDELERLRADPALATIINQGAATIERHLWWLDGEQQYRRLQTADYMLKALLEQARQAGEQRP